MSDLIFRATWETAQEPATYVETTTAPLAGEETGLGVFDTLTRHLVAPSFREQIRPQDWLPVSVVLCVTCSAGKSLYVNLTLIRVETNMW